MIESGADDEYRLKIFSQFQFDVADIGPLIVLRRRATANERRGNITDGELLPLLIDGESCNGLSQLNRF